jgi:hypothetical protein
MSDCGLAGTTSLNDQLVQAARKGDIAAVERLRPNGVNAKAPSGKNS